MEEKTESSFTMFDEMLLGTQCEAALPGKKIIPCSVL